MLIGTPDMQPAGEGTLRPIVRIHSPVVSLAQAERYLNMPATSLRRLIAAGFCKGQLSQPVQIDLHSYADHLAQSEQRGFWTQERRRRYAEAL